MENKGYFCALDIQFAGPGSMLILDNWHEVMTTQWHSPEKLSDAVHGDNITLNSLEALSRKRGDGVKILFESSVRDFNLAQFQYFIDEGLDKSESLQQIGAKEGDRYQDLLKKMVSRMRQSIPESGIYIWDDDASLHRIVYRY